MPLFLTCDNAEAPPLDMHTKKPPRSQLFAVRLDSYFMLSNLTVGRPVVHMLAEKQNWPAACFYGLFNCILFPAVHFSLRLYLIHTDRHTDGSATPGAGTDRLSMQTNLFMSQTALVVHSSLSRHAVDCNQ